MTPYLVWQLADSAFPAGSFAHSMGLEAAWQQGEVDAVSLGPFLRDVVTQTARGSLPFVAAGHRSPGDLPAIDARYDAFVRNPVANRASRVQGRAWLATLERAFPQAAVREIGGTARALPARHYAPIFGATLHALGVDADTTARLFLFSACRTVLSAAVRLGLVGTAGAQRLLAGSSGHLDRSLAACADLEMDQAAQSAPLVELWQSAHDRLYSRLFQS
jgi:urease accessory protein